MQTTPPKVLVAKPGLDGHDRGAKVVTKALMNAGMEVIYSGLHKTVEEIIETALQEDVDVVGLSILSGAHVSLSRKVLAGLREKDLANVIVVVGGVIPKKDIETLKALGVTGVFPFGTSLNDISTFIFEAVRLKKKVQ